MVAIEKIRKAGLLASSAFLLAGCGNSESTQILHAQWFFQQTHIWISLIFVICTGLFWVSRHRKYKVAVRRQRPFRCLSLAGKMFIAGAGIFLMAAIILQYVETSGQQDGALVFGAYQSDMALLKALFFFFVQIILSIIFIFLPVMLRFNYNKFLAFIFWIVSFVTIVLFYFSVPVFELAKVAGLIETSILSPTRPIWMTYLLFGLYGALITFTALVIEALIVRRPAHDKFANSIVTAFE